ncbi:hypothetical protein SSP531S_55900 [Streptomyces spongiicola]|uniref:Uncharacterized protein n=1 Tax=Streptomyces spongiicola TaxID=1690221 RepID=A0A388T5T0_9ACTN|nr:hypothetical protein [Streptomyces spongiicola]GBQ04099.1 hypothetical protein SSP531S_55900 [Streptomyces spongiicola]
MVRNVIGSALALAGAAAAVYSPFRAWYDGRRGSDYRVQDLFGGITDAPTEVGASIVLPYAFAALVALFGVMLRSRLLVALAGPVVVGFTVLWMVRQGQATGYLAVGGGLPGLGEGVAVALGGGVLLLLAAVVMRGRAPRVVGFEEPGYDGPPGGAGWYPPEHPAGYPPADGPHAWAPELDDTQRLPTSAPPPAYGPGPRRPRPDPYGAAPYGAAPYGADPGRDPFGDEWRGP